ncbi:MAG: hypothetical protein ACOCVE_07270 [Desulfovermiculus sp.]
MPPQPRIIIHQENCRGCRRCEIACSWLDHGPLNPRLAGVHILQLDNDGIDYPVLNTECQDRFCGKLSPAASRNDEPACVTACLFQALTLNTPPQEEDHA